MDSIDKSLLRAILSHLNNVVFEDFIFELLRDGYGPSHVRKVPNIGSGLFVRDLPNYLEQFGFYDGVYISYYSPLEMIKNPRKMSINDPGLVDRLKAIDDYYKKRPLGYVDPRSGFVSPRLKSLFFINNYSGYSEKDYTEFLIPKFEALLAEFGIHVEHVGVGNYDSFLENRPVETNKVLKQLFEKQKDGLCITISESDVSVRGYNVEKQILTGVSRANKNPYEPLFINRLETPSRILEEFASLIRSETRESVLEEFLTAHYNEIFGSKYDRIETQLWLRFPDLDINNKIRRLDIFLRNSVSNDWELFEVKRAFDLTRSYRDIPVLDKEVLYAVQQVKNYARILSQDKVKKHFENEGIIYYEPSLNLILGRLPQIPTEQWRWLISSNKDVNLFTYDDLLKEMQIRYDDRIRFREHMQL